MRDPVRRFSARYRTAGAIAILLALAATARGLYRSELPDAEARPAPQAALPAATAREIKLDAQTSFSTTKLPPAIATSVSAAASGDPDELTIRAAQHSLSARLSMLEERLAAISDPGERMALLAVFKREILAAPEAAAAASLADYLASGRDVDTGLPFVVGEDGMMASVPSLRTAVLDLLPATDLPRAAELAREVLQQRRSEAEFALGLRNLAWNDFEGDQLPELAARFNDLLNIDDWRRNPGNAYLEAFDIAVALGDRAAFAAVGAVLDEAPQNPAGQALSRAALVALDRMVIRDPALLVAAYHDDPTLFAAATNARASLLARLDLDKAEQRAVLVDYLGRTDHGSDELAYFAELFPNANAIHGDWLVTAQESTPSIEQRRALDRGTVAGIDAVLATAPGAAVRTVLTEVRARLVALEQDAMLDQAAPISGPPAVYEQQFPTVPHTP